MKKSLPSPLRHILLFLTDLLHAWLLSASAAILFICVLEGEMSNGAVLLSAAVTCAFTLLFLKSKYFRLALLFLLTAGGAFFLVLLLIAVITRSLNDFVGTISSYFTSLADNFDINVFSPLLVTLVTAVSSSIAVVHGKRFVYFYAAAPCVALIILSLLGAQFPPFALLVFSVSSVVLIMRNKYRWFCKLLEPWPVAGSDSSAAPSSNSVRAYRGTKFSSIRKTRGFPNLLLRAACLLLFALLLCLILRPDPPEGPLFGEDTSSAIELKFQTMLESSEFLQKLFGVEIEKGNGNNTRTKGTFGKIGGDNISGSDPILLVKTDHPGVYLRGFTYNDYLGNEWNPDRLDTSEAPLTASVVSSSLAPSNYVSIPYALYERSFLPYVYRQDLYRDRLRVLDPELTAGKSLVVQYVSPYDARFGFFIPSGSQSMRFYDKDLHFYSSPADLHLRQTEGKSIVYTVSSPQEWTLYEVSYTDVSEALIEALALYDTCVPGYYSSLRASSSYLDPYVIGTLSEFAKTARVRYTRLSTAVTTRVRELALELTKDYTDDWHKANAIKNYLLSGKYKYSLTPGDIPKGRDAVDYFLFDHPEGYCTYFASAMTVLARAAGIPARYVEGFYVNSSNLTQDDIYTLRESDLHAWCEIYMEGLGFVTIEATAGFSSAYVPGTPATVPPTGTSTPIPTEEPATPTPTEEPTELPTLPDETPTATTTPANFPTDIPTAVPPSPTAPPETVDRQFWNRTTKILIILFAAVILIFGVLLLINWLAGRRPGQRGDFRKRISSIYKRSAALVGTLSRRKDSAETPREYAEAIAPYRFEEKMPLPESVLDTFTELTEIYERSVYSLPESENELLARANGCWDNITAELAKKFGKFRTKRLLLVSAARSGQQLSENVPGGDNERSSPASPDADEQIKEE